MIYKTDLDLLDSLTSEIYSDFLEELVKLVNIHSSITFDELEDLLITNGYEYEIEENEEFEDSYNIYASYEFDKEDYYYNESHFDEYKLYNGGTVYTSLTLYNDSDIIKDLYIEYYGPFDWRGGKNASP